MQPRLFEVPEEVEEEPEGTLSTLLEIECSYLPDGAGSFVWRHVTPDREHVRSVTFFEPGSTPMQWEDRIRVVLDCTIFPDIEPF